MAPGGTKSADRQEPAPRQLIVDIRRDTEWRTKLIGEIDRLRNVPVDQTAATQLSTGEVLVGDSFERFFDIGNPGLLDPRHQSASSDIDGITVELGSTSVAQETAPRSGLRSCLARPGAKSKTSPSARLARSPMSWPCGLRLLFWRPLIRWLSWSRNGPTSPP